MRLTSILLVASVLGPAAVSAASAQTVATWQEVQVNPVRPGGGVLLYPGGEYSRNVSPLLYPGEHGGSIRLHMPAPHRRVASAAPREAPREAAPKPAPPKPAPAPKPAPKLASAAPPPAQTPSLNPFGGATNLSNVFGNAPPPPKTAPAGP